MDKKKNSLIFNVIGIAFVVIVILFFVFRAITIKRSNEAVAKREEEKQIEAIVESVNQITETAEKTNEEAASLTTEETPTEDEEIEPENDIIDEFQQYECVEMEKMMVTLDASLVKENFDVVNDGGFALTYLDETVFPYIEETKLKYKGSKVEDVIGEYEQAVYEYKDALDYFLSSTNKMTEMSANVDNGALRTYFDATWKILDSQAYNKGTKPQNVGTRLYTLWQWEYISCDNIFAEQYNRTTDEMYDLYIEGMLGLYHSYDDNEQSRRNIISYMYMSEDEYTNLEAIAKGNCITIDEYNSELSAIQTTLKDKIAKYQSDYMLYNSHVAELVEE